MITVVYSDEDQRTLSDLKKIYEDYCEYLAQRLSCEGGSQVSYQAYEKGQLMYRHYLFDATRQYLFQRLVDYQLACRPIKYIYSREMT